MLIENAIFIGYAPKLDTNFLWQLTYLSIILTITYITFSVFFSGKMGLWLNKSKVKKKKLTPMVSRFLFMEDDATSQEKQEYLDLKLELRSFLKAKQNRKILSEVLVELRQDLSGELLEKLFKIYKDFGLEKDAYSKLNNWKWFIVTQGIVELTSMEVDGSYGRITKFINDRRSIIRKQAELSVVTLKDEGLKYFLDTTNKNISEWQQFRMLDVLAKKSKFSPPKFKNWLTSKNRDTVLFCIRLIKYYNQFEAADAIQKLIRHKDAAIRTEAVICSKKFMLTETSEDLKSVFLTSTDDCKLLIIDALESFEKQEDLEFLELVHSSNNVFAVKNKAGVAVNEIIPNTRVNDDDLETISHDYLAHLLNNQEETKTDENIVVLVDEKLKNNNLVPETAKDDNQETWVKNIDENILDKEEEEEEEVKYFDNELIFKDLDIEFAEANLNIVEKEEENNEVAEIEELLLNFDLSLAKPEQDSEIEIEEPEKVPIDNEKHIEFIEFMSTKETAESEIDNQSTVREDLFNELFFDKSHYEKFNLLNEIAENGDEHEISLLQTIIDREANDNIKNKAILILQKIENGEDVEPVIENSMEEDSKTILFPAQTVFKDLYNSCDTEAKLILLQEIGALGDEIELQFLKEKLNAEDESIRKKAAEVKTILEKRLGITTDIDYNIEIIEDDFEAPKTTKAVDLNKDLNHNKEMSFEKYDEKHSADISKEMKIGMSADELISLEFCFLLDELDIKPSNTLDDLDFDLSEKKNLSN